MPDATQLDRIEAKLDKIERHLRVLNGQVASHDQTLHGPKGQGGIVDDVRALAATIRPVGTISTRTLWAAVGSLAAVLAVVVALLVGVQP